MNTKEFREMWFEEEVILVQSKPDTSYRHGCYMNEVYHHPGSDTYWQVFYTISGDGEQNGIRDDEFTMNEVKPVTETVVVTKYVPVNPPEPKKPKAPKSNG